MLKRFLLRTSCAAVLAAALASAGLADTIRLKDGSLIKGTIVAFKGGKFVVAIGEGVRRREMSFYADEIDSIQFDSADQTLASRTTASYSRSAPDDSNNSKTYKVVTTNGSNSGKSTPQRPNPVTSSTPKPANPSTDDGDVVTTTTTKPQVTTPPVLSDKGTSRPAAGYGKPIEVNVKVLADDTANGWTNSGWVVKRGQRIRITGVGNISLGKGKSTAPSGLSDIEDGSKLMKSVPTGALIAVIGDDNND
ncbi:MAG TPA: hypothetical protein VHL50_04110, partial [Pyrinomonadaceae bacterium]|nr:hypothetical protein [Pyrinomonadaceae bacterium]